MSDAFFSAWSLMKAPLDFDSIRRIKTKAGPKVTTADFIHPDPEIDEKLKLMLFGGNTLHAYEQKDVRDDPYDSYNEVARAYYHSPVTRDGESLPFQTEMIEVDDKHRRKGLASSMHTLMAHVAEKYGNNLHPAFLQTEEGRRMWAKQLGVERPFRINPGSAPTIPQLLVQYQRGEDADTWRVRDDL